MKAGLFLMLIGLTLIMFPYIYWYLYPYSLDGFIVDTSRMLGIIAFIAGVISIVIGQFKKRR
jgi:hypothetical protein